MKRMRYLGRYSEVSFFASISGVQEISHKITNQPTILLEQPGPSPYPPSPLGGLFQTVPPQVAEARGTTGGGEPTNEPRAALPTAPRPKIFFSLVFFLHFSRYDR